MTLAEKRRHKQIFLVIDDAGLVFYETKRFLDIPVSMTIAALPHLKETKRVCQAIWDDPLKETILHQPMEAYNKSKNPGPGAIYNDTPVGEVSEILDDNLHSVRGVVGMNNHMGSRVTENVQLMSEVLQYCQAKELFFLDSKTAYNSQVPKVAAKMGMHMEERHIFLDIQHDRNYIRGMWGSAVAHARDFGYVVVIGHVWSPESAAAIRDSYESLLNQGYTFHKLSELYS